MALATLGEEVAMAAEAGPTGIPEEEEAGGKLLPRSQPNNNICNSFLYAFSFNDMHSR
jgi:hypothetical protein